MNSTSQFLEWNRGRTHQFPGQGVYEWYRMQAAEVENKLSALPECAYGYSLSPKVGEATVKLHVGCTTTVFGLSGQKYTPDRDGYIMVTPEDAKPLIAAGVAKPV